MIAIGKTPLVEMILMDKFIDQSDGTVTIEFLDDGLPDFEQRATMSVQPDGTVERRPRGANGVYERGTPDGSTVIFAPPDIQGHRRVFAFAVALKVPV